MIKPAAPFDINFDSRNLNQQFTFDFEVLTNGIYFIEVTASARSKKQNIYPRWAWGLPLPVRILKGKDDDDLYLTISSREFPKLGDVGGLYNSPVAWSGTSLRNTAQTNAFVLFLEQGSHNLSLHPEQTPTLKRIRCEQLEIPQSFGYPLQHNNSPEQKERAPWCTFTLVDLPLTELTIQARVEKRRKWLFFSEDDDIKVVLNGNVQFNKDSRAHKNWFFCGRARAGSYEFSAKPRWRLGLHHIELWADWTPKLEKLSFHLVQPYKSYLNRDYNRFDKKILKITAFWNSFFLKQKYSPLEPLDPNLVKAMVYRESKIGYHPGGEVDILQVWGNQTPEALLGEPGFPASEFVNEEEIDHISYSYPKGRAPEVGSPQESIFWGVRWLYHKAQYLPNLEKPYKREWRTWKEAVWNYNANPDLVEDYVNEIFSIYEKGVDKKGSVLWEG